MAQETPTLVKIAVLSNIIEAQVVESMLVQHAIPHRLRSFHDTAYDGLFQLQKGWGEVYAPLERKHEILEIIHDTRQADHSDPGRGTGDEP